MHPHFGCQPARGDAVRASREVNRTRELEETIMRVATLIVAIAAALGASTASAQSGSSPLVGEWAGSWMAAGERTGGGQLYITVKSLEGERAILEVEQHSPLGVTRSTPVATFRDNRLTWEFKVTNQRGRVELAVDGDKMKGGAEGIRRINMELVRKK
jgi:hypothetical protein